MVIVRRITQAVLLVLVLLVGTAGLAAAVSQTAWFKDWLRGYIVREASGYLNGQLSIGRLTGNLFTGVELTDVIVSMSGQPVVTVEDIGLSYNVLEMISSGMSVHELRLTRPVVYMRRSGDTWTLAQLIKKQEAEADRQGPTSPITVDRIGISQGTIALLDRAGNGAVTVPERFDDIDAQLSFKYEPVHYSLEVSHVSFRSSKPSVALNTFSGTLAVRDDTIFVDDVALRTEESSIAIDGAVKDYLGSPHLEFQVSSDKLSMAEVGRIVPAVAGVQLTPAFEVRLDGPFDHLGLVMNVRSSAGTITGSLTTDAMAPGQSVTGDISVRSLDLAPILSDPSQRSDITADAHLDLTADSFSDLDSLKGSASVEAPRIAAAGYAADGVRATARFAGRRVALDARGSAYRAALTASGSVTIPEGGRPLEFDLRGRARRVDLRRLPRALDLPRADTDVDVDYRVAGTIPSERQGFRGRGPKISGNALLHESTIAGARVASGSTAAFSMAEGRLDYELDATVANADLQRIGRAFDIAALAADQYQTTLNAHIVSKGSQADQAPLNITANGTLTDSVLLGGRVPQMAFDATVANDTARVKANGSFVDIDTSVVTGKPSMAGAVSGTLNVDATLEALSSGVRPDSIEGTATVELQPTTIGGLAIDRAVVDADYADQSATIRTLEITGRDLNVKADGHVAFDETGQSNLTVHADSSNLESIGALLDTPLTGIAKIDATITGNRRELGATGTVIGNGLRYGNTGALTTSATFTATIPDLDVACATIDADTRATFVTVAGQNVNELEGHVGYANSAVRFDVTARQPERAVSGTGSLKLLTDYQEVQLERLDLESKGQHWQLAPGSAASVRYGGDGVEVNQFQLLNGDQRMTAQGSLGRPADALRVTLENVDLVGVDALLLREPQLTGRLNGSASVRGTPAEPSVSADFRVDQGAFRQFAYDSLTGTVAYEGKGVTVDARLDQDSQQWITAKGFVPAALFSSTAPDDTIDLAIDSSPMSLGLIQGFTSALTDVQGTVEAHVKIAGSAKDPQPSGALTIRDGVINVVPTGVTYSHIAGRVDFQPDRVHIDQITVLDNHDSALSLTGDLAIRERQLGDVRLYVNSDDFKVVDNEMGNVRIQSQLEIAGELRAPRLEGYMGPSTGTVNLDRIISMLGTSAYSTTPIDVESEAERAGEVPVPSGFGAWTIDVGVTIPDALILRASSIETATAPISLGALTVTVGGDLQATKSPSGAVLVRGIVTTIRGNYEFQGRQFEILRDGSLRFEGLDTLNPSLDVRTRRLIQGVEARVNIVGTLQQPEVRLSSTPPLDDADILSLIVFNQPINQLGEEQQMSLVARAQSIATGAVAGQLASSIARALNLETFEIDVAPETGGGPRLTMGQQLGQNLYVKVQQGIGDESMTNVVLEYELMRWLRLQTNVVQGSSTQQSLFRRQESTGADLIFLFSY